MSDSSQVMDALKNVLEKALLCTITQMSISRTTQLQNDKRWVAAIEFFGQHHGFALMALSDDDSDMAIAYIFRKLGLSDGYVPPFTVYPEVLNMCAGHMITALERQGEVYSIHPPAQSLPFSPYNCNAQYAVSITTDQGFVLGIYFYMKDSHA